MRRIACVIAMAGTLSVAQALHAQGGIRERGALRAGRVLERQERNADTSQGRAPKRQLLEQQVRRSFWRTAKLRIGFTDDQMLRLEQVSQRFDQRRRSLAQDERAQRVALRMEILADSSPNQAAIAAALDKIQSVQRQRVELQADEQKEFATFMTPLQRARFLALQEQVRRRLQELVRARPDSQAVAPNF